MIDVNKRYLDAAKRHKKMLKKVKDNKEKKFHEKLYYLYMNKANREDNKKWNIILKVLILIILNIKEVKINVINE